MKIKTYDLQFDVRPHEKTMRVEGIIEIQIDQESSSFSLLLYKDLIIRHIRCRDGEVLAYQQGIVSIAGNQNQLVNQVQINFDRFRMRQGLMQLEMSYEGSLNGYESVMKYVKDQIDSNFTLIRCDCLAYPILALANEESLIQGILNSFKYKVAVKVPYDYVVAGGGTLTHQSLSSDSITYYYENSKESNRLDLAISEYRWIEDQTHQLKFFVFKQDYEIINQRIKPELIRTFKLFKEHFGARSEESLFTLIEIKEGYGSQSGQGYVLMEEHGYTEERQQLTHLYHEIAHQWNILVDDKLNMLRFFDEAFASYFEAYAIRSFYGVEAYFQKLNYYREYFSQMVQYSLVNKSPIITYGDLDLAYNSYTKGAWSLALIHGLMGDDNFDEFIRQLLAHSKQSPFQNFQTFQLLAEKQLNHSLKRFMNEWIYGVESSDLLLSELTLEEMIQRYEV